MPKRKTKSKSKSKSKKSDEGQIDSISEEPMGEEKLDAADAQADSDPGPESEAKPEPEPTPELEPVAPPPAPTPESLPEPALPKIPLRVFEKIAGPKWDQLAGFKRHAKNLGLGPMTVPEWRGALEAYRNKPVKAK